MEGLGLFNPFGHVCELVIRNWGRGRQLLLSRRACHKTLPPKSIGTGTLHLLSECPIGVGIESRLLDGNVLSSPSDSRLLDRNLLCMTESGLLDRHLLSRPKSRLLNRNLLSSPPESRLLDRNLSLPLPLLFPLLGLLRLHPPPLSALPCELRKLPFCLARMRALGVALLLVPGASGTAATSFLWQRP